MKGLDAKAAIFVFFNLRISYYSFWNFFNPWCKTDRLSYTLYQMEIIHAFIKILPVLKYDNKKLKFCSQYFGIAGEVWQVTSHAKNIHRLPGVPCIIFVFCYSF